MSDLCPHCNCRPCSRLHACPRWKQEYEELMARLEFKQSGAPQERNQMTRTLRTSFSRQSAMPGIRRI